MLIKNLIDEDFVNYKRPSMFIGCHSCTFKCDKLAGKQVCQNGTLAKSPDINISIEKLIDRYLNNPYSEAIVFGGLEPFDDLDNVVNFISKLREWSNDNVVIYTGYTEEEIHNMFPRQFNQLVSLKNVIVKYGRFIPDEESHFDNVLGVFLQSNNQYAVKLS